MKKPLLAALMALLTLTGCTEIQLASHITKSIAHSRESKGTFKVGNPYKIDGKWYTPKEEYDLVETGIASWYGPKFHGKTTANGEIFDMNELTAAHRTLQLPSIARVTNLENGRSIIVRINDRGPYKRGRVLDASRRSAELLGFKEQGHTKVKIEVLSKESMEVAEAARQGKDTRGYELAYNRGGVTEPYGNRPEIQQASYLPEQPAQIEPAAGTTASAAPTPKVDIVPVVPTNTYVQAGSFTNYDNALGLQQSLNQVAQANIYPVDINGQTFYRVRVGPFEDVARADQILNTLAHTGNSQAIIVVD